VSTGAGTRTDFDLDCENVLPVLGVDIVQEGASFACLKENTMSSRRLRRAASRANGKKSAGPVTPEAQAPSAAIATGHCPVNSGRLASSVCLSNENRAAFIEMYETLVREHTPASPTEHLLVEEMAVARWRQQRAWTIETYLLENQMDRMTNDLEKEYVSIHEASGSPSPSVNSPKNRLPCNCCSDMNRASLGNSNVAGSNSRLFAAQQSHGNTGVTKCANRP